MSNSNPFDRALLAIRQAQAVALHTGAGMGVDSGLPDFRGPEGFWKSYPPLRHLGLRFEEMANPSHFDRDPSLAWGFYGHRLQLYRDTVPHDGVQILKELIDQRPLFAFTSNIDGHLQAAGVPESHLVEVHGSLLWLQCTVPCCRAIWSAEDTQVAVDMDRCRAAAPLPICPHCGAIARPNVLMFGDWSFIGDRTESQGMRYHQWLNQIDLSRLVIIEIGAEHRGAHRSQTIRTTTTNGCHTHSNQSARGSWNPRNHFNCGWRIGITAANSRPPMNPRPNPL